MIPATVLSLFYIIQLPIAYDLIGKYGLNEGQADALLSVATMFKQTSDTNTTSPICIIKGFLLFILLFH